MRNLTVKPLAIDSKLNHSTRRIGFIPKGVIECATQTHMWKPGYQSLHLRTTSFLVSELVIVCSSCSFSSKVLVHLADSQNFRSDTRNDVALSCQRITSTLEQSDDRSNKRGGSSNQL
ncbi:hypothetical protein YC2023_056346 [Brassica napus]